jgi:hypothetical protein
MSLLTRPLSVLRTWLGLGDPSDDHLTPSHGWLLPPAEEAVARPEEGGSAPETRLRMNATT